MRKNSVRMQIKLSSKLKAIQYKVKIYLKGKRNQPSGRSSLSRSPNGGCWWWWLLKLVAIGCWCFEFELSTDELTEEEDEHVSRFSIEKLDFLLIDLGLGTFWLWLRLFSFESDEVDDEEEAVDEQSGELLQLADEKLSLK